MIKAISLIECPVCSSKIGTNSCKNIPYESVFSSKKLQDKLQTIYFCQGCKAGIAYPLVDEKEIEYIYKEGSCWNGNARKTLSFKYNPGHYALACARWNFIKSFIKKSCVSVLDIGAGQGFLGRIIAGTKNMRLTKYSIIEVDVCLRESFKQFWTKVFPNVELEASGTINNVRGRYDIVIFSHLLEHINNPKLILEAASRKMQPGGLLFIDVPNQDCYFKKDYFPHLLFYSNSGIKRMLDDLNFDIKKIACFGRNRVKSPINYKNLSSRLVKLGKIMYKIRAVLPLGVSREFFNWYFGANLENKEGTWVRALAQKQKN